MSDDPSVSRIQKDYQRELAALGMVDYDDLLTLALDALRSKPDLKRKYQQQCFHLLVDEFQDLSPVQYSLLRCLVGHNSSLFVIGDPNQSIYTFRGADSGVIDSFLADYPQAKKMSLIHNYRNPEPIVRSARRLFPRSPKATAASSDCCLQLIKIASLPKTSSWIADFISQSVGGLDLNSSHLRQVGESRYRFGDFAVLFRARHFGRILADYFARFNIPYQLIGEDSVFCHPKVVRFLAVLKKITLTPGDSEIASIHRRDLPLYRLLSPLASTLTIAKLIRQAAPLLNISEDVCLRFISAVNFLDDGQQRLNRLFDFVDQLSSNNFFDHQSDRVVFSTIHSVKGLEFDHVFLVGFEQGIIPHQDIDSGDEKRLFYVAMTRAKTGLHLIYQHRPSVYSQIIDSSSVRKIEVSSSLPPSKRQLKLFSL